MAFPVHDLTCLIAVNMPSKVRSELLVQEQIVDLTPACVSAVAGRSSARSLFAHSVSLAH